MAILQISYHSKAMNREVTLNALIPLAETEVQGNNLQDASPMKSLYLLHGYSGNFTDWVNYTRIRELSDKYRIAVFMPAGENHFYIDDVDTKTLYGEYVGNELVQFTRKMFPLSDRKEDTMIGGLSMGGYGAIRNGLKYADNFGSILALSSAMITYKISNASPDYADEVADYHYFTRVFGDLTKLEGTDKDPEALISKLKESRSEVPAIYMACGTEDFLLDVNHRFRDFLSAEEIKFTYEESPGDHTWEFWDKYLEKALEWALK